MTTENLLNFCFLADVLVPFELLAVVSLQQSPEMESGGSDIAAHPRWRVDGPILHNVNPFYFTFSEVWPRTLAYFPPFPLSSISSLVEIGGVLQFPTQAMFYCQ